MPISNWGIFRGGQLTRDVDRRTLNAAPALLTLSDGTPVGFGGGRAVAVLFNQAVASFDFQRSAPSEFEPPIYTLRLGAAAGSCVVVYDPTIGDLVLKAAALTTDVVFGGVTWPINAAAMSQLTLDTSVATRSGSLAHSDPLGANSLYWSGMDFGDVAFNTPLVLLKTLCEALWAKLAPASRQDVSLLDISALVAVDDDLTVPPTELARLTRDARGLPQVRLVNTQVATTLQINTATYVGGLVYLLVDPDTAALSVAANPDANKLIMAYANVGTLPGGAPQALSDLAWQLVGVGDVGAQSCRGSLSFSTLPAQWRSSDLAPTEVQVATSRQDSIATQFQTSVPAGAGYLSPGVADNLTTKVLLAQGINGQHLTVSGWKQADGLANVPLGSASYQDSGGNHVLTLGQPISWDGTQLDGNNKPYLTISLVSSDTAVGTLMFRVTRLGLQDVAEGVSTFVADVTPAPPVGAPSDTADFLSETAVTWPIPYPGGVVRAALEIDDAHPNPFPAGVLHVMATTVGARIWCTKAELLVALGESAFDRLRFPYMWQDTFLVHANPTTEALVPPTLSWDVANRLLTWTVPPYTTLCEIRKDGVLYLYGRIATNPFRVPDDVYGSFQVVVTYSDGTTAQSSAVVADKARPLTAVDTDFLYFNPTTRVLTWHPVAYRRPNVDAGPGAEWYLVTFSPSSGADQSWLVAGYQYGDNEFVLPSPPGQTGAVRLTAINHYGQSAKPTGYTDLAPGNPLPALVGIGPLSGGIAITTDWPIYADGSQVADGSVTAGG